MKLDMPLRRKARIEMLPLIDIVFLLLVVFIYAMLSMAVHRGMPVVLPTSSTAGIDKQEFLSITVQARDSQLQPVIYVACGSMWAWISGLLLTCSTSRFSFCRQLNFLNDIYESP